LTRYVALLRAINVGGHVVKMTVLRECFEALRFREVETVIASGNVLFSAPSGDAAALERRIEGHLAGALGYEVATFLRTPGELAAIVVHEPFPHATPVAAGHALSVAFLKAPLSVPARSALLGLRTPTDEFHVHRREAYWLCHGRTSDSKVSGARLEKAAGGPATVRNITTVRKLAEALA
jgi:uncharacterized protein (DUF1697 family)